VRREALAAQQAEGGGVDEPETATFSLLATCKATAVSNNLVLCVACVQMSMLAC
jgi:hypothetical protein